MPSLALLAPASAHGKKHHGSEPAATPAGEAAAPARPAPPEHASPEPAPEAAQPAVQAPPEPVAITRELVWEHGVEHVHNKLVHLPVGLALGVLLVAFTRDAARAGRVLAVAGLVSGVAGIVTGTLQASDLLDVRPELGAVLDVHRYTGWAVGGAWLLTAAAWFVPGAGRATRIAAGAVLVVAVTVAGLFGGWLALG